MSRNAAVGMPSRLVAMALAGSCGIAQAITYQVPLNYNFNGIVHPGEAGMADNPDGYRSIADRGIDYTGLTGSLVAPYRIVPTAGTLDIVHLGNRDTVGNGFRPFDPAPDGDGEGIIPNWLPNPDQTGPQTTTFAPVQLGAGASSSVLFQVSNGGGSFDVRFGFTSGPDFVGTLTGPDWFAFDSNPGSFGGPGAFKATENTDAATPSPDVIGLRLSVGGFSLAPHAGRMLSSVTFENRSNTSGGYAVFAMNVNNVIPEPSSAALCLIGAIGSGQALRRRR